MVGSATLGQKPFGRQTFGLWRWSCWPTFKLWAIQPSMLRALPNMLPNVKPKFSVFVVGSTTLGQKPVGRLTFGLWRWSCWPTFKLWANQPSMLRALPNMLPNFKPKMSVFDVGSMILGQKPFGRQTFGLWRCLSMEQHTLDTNAGKQLS